jgi:hypothetical protein
MGIFKKIFGGGAAGNKGSGKRGFGGGDARGLYLYIKPFGCDEIVQVRIDKHNDLSESDDGVLFARKLARGTKCTRSVEMEIFFDKNRNYVDAQLKGGELVDEAAYLAWQEKENSKP